MAHQFDTDSTDDDTAPQATRSHPASKSSRHPAPPSPMLNVDDVIQEVNGSTRLKSSISQRNSGVPSPDFLKPPGFGSKSQAPAPTVDVGGDSDEDDDENWDDDSVSSPAPSAPAPARAPAPAPAPAPASASVAAAAVRPKAGVSATAPASALHASRNVPPQVAVSSEEESGSGSEYTDDSGSDSEDGEESDDVQDLNPPLQAPASSSSSSSAAAAPAPATAAAAVRNIRSEAANSRGDVAVSAAAAAVQPPSAAPSSGPARTIVRSSAAADPHSPAPVPAVLVASSLENSSSSSSQISASLPATDVSLDIETPPGNPCLHTLSDVIMALQRAVTQHHFSMVLVATGLVFIIAGGSVRARPLDPATDKDTTLGIALAVLGAYLFVIPLTVNWLNELPSKLNPIAFSLNLRSSTSDINIKNASSLVLVTCLMGMFLSIYGASLMNAVNSGAPALGACFVFVAWLMSMVLFSILSLEWHSSFRDQLSHNALAATSVAPGASQPKRRRRLRALTKMLLEKAPIQHHKRPKTYQAAVYIMVVYTTILLASSLAIVYSSDAAPRRYYRRWLSDSIAYGFGVFVAVLSSVQAVALAVFASIFAPEVPIGYIVTKLGGLNDPMQGCLRFSIVAILCTSIFVVIFFPVAEYPSAPF